MNKWFIPNLINVCLIVWLLLTGIFYFCSDHAILTKTKPFLVFLGIEYSLLKELRHINYN